MTENDCAECGGSRTDQGDFACVCDHIPDATKMVPSDKARELVCRLEDEVHAYRMGNGSARDVSDSKDAVYAYIASLEAANAELLKRAEAAEAERDKYRKSMENTGWTFEGEWPKPPLGNPPPFIYEDRIKAAAKCADELQQELDEWIAKWTNVAEARNQAEARVRELERFKAEITDDYNEILQQRDTANALVREVSTMNPYETSSDGKLVVCRFCQQWSKADNPEHKYCEWEECKRHAEQGKTEPG